nr:uncharacterized protein LOC108020182 [Drosophila suzukii]
MNQNFKLASFPSRLPSKPPFNWTPHPSFNTWTNGCRRRVIATCQTKKQQQQEQPNLVAHGGTYTRTHTSLVTLCRSKYESNAYREPNYPRSTLRHSNTLYSNLNCWVEFKQLSDTYKRRMLNNIAQYSLSSYQYST